MTSTVDKNRTGSERNAMKTPVLCRKVETPKTSGGISLSLLTPCRSIGLSRFRKSTPSGVNLTPVSGQLSEEINDTPKLKRVKSTLSKNNKKAQIDVHDASREGDDEPIDRGKRSTSEELEESEHTTPKKIKNNYFIDHSDVVPDNTENSDDDLNLSRLQKSKSNSDTVENTQPKKLSKKKSKILDKKSKNPITSNETLCIETNSVEKIKINSDKNAIKSKNKLSEENKIKSEPMSCDEPQSRVQNLPYDSKADSEIENKTPKDISLTKKCIIVLDKQLSRPKRQSSKKIKSYNEDDNEDFIQKPKKSHSKLIDHTNIEKSQKAVTKAHEKCKPKNTLAKLKEKLLIEPQDSNKIIYCGSDSEDEGLFKGRTILVRKVYEKNVKPSNQSALLKSKSTGDIEDKELDEIRERIRQKELKLKATIESKNQNLQELEDLITKWKEGCQNALSQLLDLMKTHLPNNENMEMGDLLNMLKIPHDLVDYNSEEMSFVIN